MPLHDPQIPADPHKTPMVEAGSAAAGYFPPEISKISTVFFSVTLGEQDEPIYEKVLALLTEHLGSRVAAISWLNSSGTGYPGTAIEAIQQGHASLVLADLEAQWGPGPSYA